MSTDLKIRIISNLHATQQVLMYQQDLQLNVKNYKVAAWEHPYIAPQAQFNTVLPMNIGVSASTELGRGTMQTKSLNADYNTAWEIFENSKALDIRKSNDPSPSESTIEILNKCDSTKYAVVTKDGKSLFACEVRPEFKVNFAVHPKLYIALSDLEINDEFFDAATLSKSPVVIDYEGQEYLTVYLSDNVSTGLVTITYDFAKFD
ncbi:MAG: hypothetical protein Q4G07_05485 [Oscillospiraceae bacterium]|nr:hypothetical protein [Oscillospiraceae bacterium]